MNEVGKEEETGTVNRWREGGREGGREENCSSIKRRMDINMHP